jgi:hypothetical protein
VWCALRRILCFSLADLSPPARCSHNCDDQPIHCSFARSLSPPSLAARCVSFPRRPLFPYLSALRSGLVGRSPAATSRICPRFWSLLALVRWSAPMRTTLLYLHRLRKWRALVPVFPSCVSPHVPTQPRSQTCLFRCVCQLSSFLSHPRRRGGVPVEPVSGEQAHLVPVPVIPRPTRLPMPLRLAQASGDTRRA